MNRIFRCALGFVLPLSCFAVTLPYETDFEASEGFGAGLAPSGWTVAGGVTVTDGDSASGRQSVRFPAGGGRGAAALEIAGGSPAVCFIDFYLRPAAVPAGALPGEAEPGTSALTGFVKVDPMGEVYVADGSGLTDAEWIATGWAVPLEGERAGRWVRYTYRLDYADRKWDLYLDGELVAADLGFLDPSLSSLGRFEISDGGAADAHFDFFYAGAPNPLFADADADGIPDAFETAHGLDPAADDRDADPDLDGAANLREYMGALDPAAPDTDGDGVPDGWEIDAGDDPLVAEARGLAGLPHAEGFEPPADPVSLAAAGWTFGPRSLVGLDFADPFAGTGALRLGPAGLGETVSAARGFHGAAGAPVWLDFRLRPARRGDSEGPPPLAPHTTAAFYFGGDGALRVFDGAATPPAWLPLDGFDHRAGAWRRFTLRLDYAAQDWALWLDNVLAAEGLGFAAPAPFFTGFALTHGAHAPAGLDELAAGHVEPAGLDDDGDGVENAREIRLGTDPRVAEDHGPILGRYGLKLWLDAGSGLATDAQGRVASWADRSGNLSEALQDDPARRPEPVDGPGGRPAVLFDGVDDYLEGASAFDPSSADFTLVLVHRRTGGHDLAAPFSYSTTLESHGAPLLRWGPEPGAFGINAVGFGPEGVYNDLAGHDSGGYLITTVTREGGGVGGLGGHITLKTLGESGTLVDSGAQSWGGGPATAFYLGRKRVTGDHFFGGAIAEVLVFEGALDPADRIDLERLLGEKYGLDLDLDADGLSDRWECEHFGSLDEDAAGDFDLDGIDNGRERVLGTDPTAAEDLGPILNHPGLQVWLRADRGLETDAGGRVLAWRDRSGRARRLAAPSAGAAPCLAAAGGQAAPVVRFDGLDDVLSGDAGFDAGAGDFTIVLVQARTGGHDKAAPLSFCTDAATYGAPLLRFGPEPDHMGINAVGFGPDGLYHDLGPDHAGRIHITAVTRTGGASGLGGTLRLRTAVDGARQENTAAQTWTSGSSTILSLGRKMTTQDHFYGGDIREVLVFDTALDTAALRAIEADLAERHGLSLDSDGDGLPDPYERAHGLDPYDPADADADADADTLTTGEEYAFGSDLRYADADNDGLDDAAERTLGTDPNQADSDGDGHPDGVEVAAGTDPLDPANFDPGLAEATLDLEYHFNPVEGFEAGGLPPAFRLEYGSVDFGVPFSPDSANRSLRLSNTGSTLLRFSAPAAVAGKSVITLAFAAAPEVLESPEHLASLPIVVDSVQTAFVAEADGATARLHVRHGGPDAVWIPLEYTAPVVASGRHVGMLDAWPEIVLVLDYARREAAVFVDGALLAADLPFLDDGVTAFAGYAWASTGTARSAIDRLRLSADARRTAAWHGSAQEGIPLGWKLENGYPWDEALDLDADADADGRSLYEEMLRGSDPHAADPAAPAHGLQHQIWTGVRMDGTSGYDFVSRYPPSEESYAPAFQVTDFDAAATDRYGRRLRGYLTPEVTGFYTFRGTWDASGELWLSTDDSPANRRRIALRDFPPIDHLDYTLLDGNWEQAEWRGQRSHPVHLEAGQRYFIEILAHGLRTSELYGVRWQHESWSQPVVLPDSLLSPYAYAPVIDADDDYFSDAEEVEHGLDPRSPWFADGQFGDPDADGALNHEEFGHLQSHPTIHEVFSPPARDSIDGLAGAALAEIATPWASAPFGPAAPGDAFLADDALVIVAEGPRERLLPSADSGQMVHQTLGGSFRITAKLDFLQSDDTAAQAGLLLAPAPDLAEPRAAFIAGADGSIHLFAIPAAGSPFIRQTLREAGPGPVGGYLRLAYDGRRLRVERSPDGVIWTRLAETDFTMDSTFVVGPFASSQSPRRHVAARFEQLEVELDSDADGLYDHEEAALGTDPLVADSDGDGLDDYTEVRVLGTDPLVANTPAFTSLATATGSSATAVSGSWRVEGESIRALDYRGEIELSLDFPAAGFYRLDVTVREGSEYRDRSAFILAAALGGIPVGSQTGEATPDAPLTLSYWLPWTAAGSRSLALDWVFVQSGSTLRVDRVELVGVDFGDEAANAAWAANRLAGEVDLGEGFAASAVSPWSYEGRAADPAQVAILAGPAAEAVEALPALTGSFRAEVPLAPADGPTQVSVSAHGGLVSETVSALWTLTNFADMPGEAPLLRPGDSLRLGWEDAAGDGPPLGLYLEVFHVESFESADALPATDGQQTYWNLSDFDPDGALPAFLEAGMAAPLDAVSAAVHDRADGTIRPFANAAERAPEPFAPAPVVRVDALGLSGGEAVALRFDAPGRYILRAIWRDAAGEPFEAVLGVRVPATDLGGPVALTSGYTRQWTPPALADEAVLQSDPAIFHAEHPDTDPRRFDIAVSGSVPARLLARLGPDGPVADSTGVLPILNYSQIFGNSLKILDTFTDGSRLVEFIIAVGGEIPQDFAVEILPISAGVLFDDGTLSRTITAEDLDELGRYRYRMIVPADVPGSACHFYQFQQNGDPINRRI